jgi:hypothetical protein
MSNITVQYPFKNRKPYVAYAFNIASCTRETPKLMKRDRPLFVSLIGDPNSGKELIALAFDLAFNPSRYPTGEIGRNVKADDVMTPANAGAVCFHGSDTRVLQSKQSFDGHLRELAQQAPQSHVHIVSNLLRSDDESIPSYEDGFNSDLLDMAITVRKDDDFNVLRESGLDAFVLDQMLNSFNRTVNVTVLQKTPLSKIIQSLKPS